MSKKNSADIPAKPLVMSLKDYAQYDALGLMQLLRNGEVTAQELSDLAQAGIDKLNPELNFMVSRTTAKEIAAAINNTDPAFALGGLPFLVKEGMGMKGQPSVMGSRLGQSLLCEADGELSSRLRKAGVVILGSTNTPDFGSAPTTESVLHGPVHNPWNLQHSSGGSSGGSAAAVAAGVVPVAQGSDGGGSIRSPAHCCGVFGLKPTRARVPTGEGFGGLYSLGVAHVCTRTVRDSAAFLDCLQGARQGDLYRVAPPERPFSKEVGAAPGRLRIAFSTQSPSGAVVHPECIEAVEAVAKQCVDLGHSVEQAAPVYEWELFKESFMDLWSSVFPYSVAVVEKATGEKAGPDNMETSILAILERGKSLTAERLVASVTQLHTLVRQVSEFFVDWDVFISPVDLTPAPRLLEINANASGLSSTQWFERTVDDYAAFLPIFNATGQPAASIPLGHSAENLPVGVQCVARHGDEATLFRLAAQLEEAMPWINRRPTHSLYQ
jgi:amidase